MLLSSNIKFLLDRHGQQATLAKNTYGTYNTATGSIGISDTTLYTIRAYFADYSLGEVDGSIVQLGDRKVYMPKDDVFGNEIPTPDIEDAITGVGDELRIKRVQQVYNSDNLVCYICQVRE